MRGDRRSAIGQAEPNGVVRARPGRPQLESTVEQRGGCWQVDQPVGGEAGAEQLAERNVQDGEDRDASRGWPSSDQARAVRRAWRSSFSEVSGPPRTRTAASDSGGSARNRRRCSIQSPSTRQGQRQIAAAMTMRAVQVRPAGSAGRDHTALAGSSGPVTMRPWPSPSAGCHVGLQAAKPRRPNICVWMVRVAYQNLHANRPVMAVTVPACRTTMPVKNDRNVKEDHRRNMHERIAAWLRGDSGGWSAVAEAGEHADHRSCAVLAGQPSG
jgi:hypothetical protein